MQDIDTWVYIQSTKQDFSRRRHLKTKGGHQRIAGAVIDRLENIAEKKLKTVRADQGGEFVDGKFKEELTKRGIKLELSDTKMAFQNGLAEVYGRKLFEMMRAARTRSQVPHKYWVENSAHQTWVMNRVSMNRQKGTTPIQELKGERANLSRAAVWGCEAWVKIRRTTKSNQDPRAERGVHLGVSQTKKAWVILLWNSRKIIESRNVMFFENYFPFRKDKSDDNVHRRNKAEAALNSEDWEERNDDEEDDQGGDSDSENDQGRMTRDSDIDQGGSESDFDDSDVDQGGRTRGSPSE